MDIFDSLFENKKQLYIVGAVYLLVVIIMLIVIWKPSNKIENEIIKYSEYNQETKNREMANYYFNLILNNFDNVVDNNISDDYLEYNKITSEELKSKYNIDKNAIIDGLTIYNFGDSIIYSSTVNYIGGSDVINIIESYPYEYNITFGNFISYTIPNDMYQSNGITFNINSVYSTKNYISYNISITNNKNEYVNIDFSDTSKIYLVTKDGQKHYLTNNSLESNNSNITKNGSMNKELVFTISLNVQGNVEKIIFQNSNIDGKNVDIEINL